MSKRVSHSVLDPYIGPVLKSVYGHLRIPRSFPPEGIVGIGHLCAAVAAVGFAFSLTTRWGGVLAALGVLANHTADCIDGTHARRTDQCRNGGELLDHFTDPLSFAYWLTGIAVAVGRLDLGIAALMVLFATAVLTNIKAKLIGEFTLSRFGPTEFKTLLFVFGLSLTVAFQLGVPARSAALSFFVVLIGVGAVQLVISLVLAVHEVNELGGEPDTTEWENRG